jgi:hypothetical protein
MTLAYESIAEELRARVPGFERVYDEHVRDYDEVLPHVLLGDLVRFLDAELRTRGPASHAAREAVSLMEEALASDDPRLQELVVVSFLENLEPAEETFPIVRGLFGPRLEAEYARTRRGSGQPASDCEGT